jgi:hypothetical protein
MPLFTKIIAICLLTLTARSSASQRSPPKNLHKKALASHKHISNTSHGKDKDQHEIFIVDSAAAVITILSTTEIEKRHKKSTDEDFYTGADNQMFYASEAQSFLERQPIKLIGLDPDYKYLAFKQANGVLHKIKLDTVVFISNLYFFDPQKRFHKVDMLDVEAEYKKYFGR